MVDPRSKDELIDQATWEVVQAIIRGEPLRGVIHHVLNGDGLAFTRRKQADPAPSVAVLAWLQMENDTPVAMSFTSTDANGCDIPLCDARIVAELRDEVDTLGLANNQLHAHGTRLYARAEAAEARADALAGVLRDAAEWWPHIPRALAGRIDALLSEAGK